MNTQGSNTISLDAIHAEAIRAYLVSHGWQQVAFKRPELLVFEGPCDDDGKPIIQVIPRSEQSSDFDTRARELLDTLSVIENRPAADVLRDIQAREGQQPESAAWERPKAKYQVLRLLRQGRCTRRVAAFVTLLAASFLLGVFLRPFLDFPFGWRFERPDRLLEVAPLALELELDSRTRGEGAPVTELKRIQIGAPREGYVTLMIWTDGKHPDVRPSPGEKPLQVRPNVENSSGDLMVRLAPGVFLTALLTAAPLDEHTRKRLRSLDSEGSSGSDRTLSVIKQILRVLEEDKIRPIAIGQARLTTG